MSSFFNTKTFLSAAIIAFGFLFSFFIIVFAQINPFDIQFPISELGNCGSTQECKIYCDDSANARACTDWAVSKGFAQPALKNEYQEKSREVVEQREGPGGCRGQKECDTFCSQPEHGEECFNFAKENGLMPPEEIQKMERGREIINKLEKQGGGPGDCRGGEECRRYCSDTSNFDECAAFSVKEGMLSPDKAQTMLREFVNIEEGKFEQFGPQGFMPQRFGSQQGPQGMIGPPGQFIQQDQIGEKFQERFKVFEQYQQGFKERDDFCAKPENAGQCRQTGPEQMTPFENKEFPGQGEPFMESQRPAGGFQPPMTPEGMKPVMPFTPEQGEEMQLRMQQMQIPPGGQAPPEGMMPGQFMPPAGMPSMPSEGMMTPPEGIPMPGGQMPTEFIPSMPGEPMPTPPSSSGLKLQYLIGTILAPFLDILR